MCHLQSNLKRRDWIGRHDLDALLVVTRYGIRIHRGPEFAKLGFDVLDGMKSIFQTKNKVIIYPSSGTGACEAALVNTLSLGDRVLMFETGQFSNIWVGIAEKMGLTVEYVPGNWRRGASPADADQPRLSMCGAESFR